MEPDALREGVRPDRRALAAGLSIRACQEMALRRPHIRARLHCSYNSCPLLRQVTSPIPTRPGWKNRASNPSPEQAGPCLCSCDLHRIECPTGTDG